jgi:hypothetical protein
VSAPNLTITVEPSEGGKAEFLPLAAPSAGAKSQVKVVLCLTIKNNESKAVHVKGIVYSFPGSSAPSTTMQNVAIDIPAGGTMQWSNGHGTMPDGTTTYNNAIYLDAPAPPQVKASLTCNGFTTAKAVTLDLIAFSSPNGSGGFLFPFSYFDLRPGEYMEASADHWANGGAPGTQIFAHDIGCIGADTGWSQTLPGKDGTKNPDWRIWSKPVRAVADGTVDSWHDGMETNTVLGKFPDPTPSPVQGNNIWIQHGDFLVNYCHFQKNTIPAALKVKGAPVKAGDKLGLAGNSGNATNPHTHVQCQKGSALRGMPFRDLWVVETDKLDPPSPDGPWVPVAGEGVPLTGVAIYPLRRSPEWLGWQDLGGTIISAPALASWAAHRLDAFAQGTDKELYHKWWDGSTWHNWQKLGGVFKDSPAAVSWGPNRIDVFVRGTNDHLMHKLWNGTAWSGWEDLGGTLTSAPAVSSWAEHRLDVFAKGTDGELYHKWWDGSTWHTWQKLGGAFKGDPAAVSWGENRIDVFVRGTNDHLMHRLWNGTAWSGWEDLAGVLHSSPAVASWDAHRLDVFVTDTEDQLRRKAWNGSKWGSFDWVGGEFHDRPAAVSWGPNRIDVVVRGMDDHLGHLWRN